MPPVKTIPPGGAPGGDLNTRDDLYRIVTRVNFVLVPVTVKDESGHLVDGLLPRDFNVFEDGKKQELKFFTSDPFPLSAAVILDTGMPDTAVQKINQTYSALSGAFSPYDEVSLYTYSTTVSQVSDFSTAGQKLTSVLNQMKLERGSNNGAPVMNGPLGPQGPTINGPISDYMRAFQAAMQPAGYLASVYGSGRTCRILLSKGLAKTGWLAQSTGFAEYNVFKPKAGIVQLPRINNSWDGDDIPDPTVVGLW